MNDKYILNERGEPVVEPSLAKWAEWFENSCHQFDGGKGIGRRVAKTQLGDASVSTVFLGLDHNFSGEGGPVYWESMIFWFGHELDQTMMRSGGSREQAEAMHLVMVARVKAAQL